MSRVFERSVRDSIVGRLRRCFWSAAALLALLGGARAANAQADPGVTHLRIEGELDLGALALFQRAVRETRAAGRRIVSVGTTTTRVLESQYFDGAYRPASGVTKCCIYPPYKFRAVDVLLTNFHLPGSSLILLVAAFAGREAVLAAYADAIRNDYRFYSYGDAMLIQSA